MKITSHHILFFIGAAVASAQTSPSPNPFAADPAQTQERTCFQTGSAWGEKWNLRSDVAIVYGIDAKLPERIKTWRDHGYRIHVMTGVSWGAYQDYLYGRFDGINHLDEAQTNRDGRKKGHGGDKYYMCPGINFGKFLSVGVQRALDAGAEAIHLEEPEFWVTSGYSEGFKREWRDHYGEDWQAPHSSVDARWRAAKLMYFLYRRALQQVFSHVQDYNKRTGRHVRCYVPTHSLLNYAQWGIVSPESSLAQLDGCDGYIAQVWTGTAREANIYRGKLKERTFETAFLEYGSMHNLVRSTGRSVWYLNDPIEDNPNLDWDDYKRNWEATLTASILQPEVSQYEVAPWPERIFNRRYPSSAPKEKRQAIPPAYATELQTVMNALNDMKQPAIKWDCGTTGIGFLVSDSLMFQRGEPMASDNHLSNVYGLAMPLVKHGIPVAPVQLENVAIPNYLRDFKVLLLSYHGMKPLTPEVHAPIAAWVKQGGTLVFCDDDSDPFNGIREWWNTNGKNYRTPREDLFARMDFNPARAENKPGISWRFGEGHVLWLRKNPAQLAHSKDGAAQVLVITKRAAELAKTEWRETNYLLLQRGPYVIAAGMDESISGETKVLHGRFVNLFDPQWRILTSVALEPGTRYFLRDLDATSGTEQQLLAAACKALPIKTSTANTAGKTISFAVEGVGDTQGGVLLQTAQAPASILLDGKRVTDFDFSKSDQILRVRFENEARPRTLTINFN